MDTHHSRLLTAGISFLAMTGITLTGTALAHPGPHGSAPHDPSDGETVHENAAHPHPGDSDNDTEYEAHPHPHPYDDPENIPTHGNGLGPDPDGDTNPATNTHAISKIGDAAEAAFDPPYRVVTFEVPPGDHDDKIRKQYKDNFGVVFSRGLSRQICEGQRYFQYNSQCTYLRAPSGQYAAVYDDEYKRPLRIRFAEPVCVAAMAIYPTGGKEGEEFEVTLQGYDADENKLDPAKLKFSWTKDTFRWRHMAGAYFLQERANRVDVSMRSLDDKEKGKPVRFLIDDVAYVEDSCSEAISSVAAAPPAPLEAILEDEEEAEEDDEDTDTDEEEIEVE